MNSGLIIVKIHESSVSLESVFSFSKEKCRAQCYYELWKTISRFVSSPYFLILLYEIIRAISFVLKLQSETEGQFEENITCSDDHEKTTSKNNQFIETSFKSSLILRVFFLLNLSVSSLTKFIFHKQWKSMKQLQRIEQNRPQRTHFSVRR